MSRPLLDIVCITIIYALIEFSIFPHLSVGDVLHIQTDRMLIGRARYKAGH